MTRLFRPLLPLLGLALAGCGGTAGPVAPAGPADITTATIPVAGKTMTVLTTPAGRTLYYFTPDSPTKVACTAACAQTWPPLLATSATPTASPSLPGKLTALDGANGKQILYNGHPLYTYVRDTASGDANGQGVAGKWFVATPGLTAAPGAAHYNY